MNTSKNISPEKSVAVIVLNYKNKDETVSCVKYLKASIYRNYTIFVVDNNSRDGSFEFLKERLSDCKVYETGDNNGYAAGNNYAIRIALNNKYDYICIINNDALVEKNTLKILVDYLNCHKQVGIVGPVICNFPETGIVQSTGFNVILQKGRTPSINEGARAEDVVSVEDCDALCGACMLIRREVFEKIGLLPEQYFLFYEETDWCLHAKKQGFLVHSIPTAKVYHKGSASVNKIKGLKLYYMSRNSVLFVRRNGSWADYLIFLCYSFLRYFYCMLIKKQSGNEILNFKAFIKGMFMSKNM